MKVIRIIKEMIVEWRHLENELKEERRLVYIDICGNELFDDAFNINGDAE